MIYATGAGAEVLRPLAVVVMGGIVTSTLLASETFARTSWGSMGPPSIAERR